MRLSTFISAFFFFMIFGLSVVSTTWAAMQLSGTARDSDGKVLVNAKIKVVDAASHQTVGNGETDLQGVYTIVVPGGTYDITVIPSKESGMPETTRSNISVTSDMMYDVYSNPKPSIVNTIRSTPIAVFVGIMVAIVLLFGFLLMRKKR